jgi:23S rRNA maturation-related 3'-5' exoribonuclease YhaM
MPSGALNLYGTALRGHPAAKSMHHPYRGGLLEHTRDLQSLLEHMVLSHQGKKEFSSPSSR